MTLLRLQFVSRHFLLVAALPLFVCSAATAQDAIGNPFGSSSSVESSPQADAENERASLELRLTQWRAKSDEFARSIKEAPGRLVKLSAEIKALERSGSVKVATTASLEELESQLAAAEYQLSLSRQEATELDEEVSRRLDRRRRVPELLTAAKSRLQSMLGSKSVTVSSDSRMKAIHAQLQELRRSALQAEIDTYQKELLSFDARGNLLAKLRDLATLKKLRAEATAEALRLRMKEMRRIEVKDEARLAAEFLADIKLDKSTKALIKGLANENNALAEKWTGEDGVVNKVDAVSRKLIRAQQHVAKVDADLANLAEKVEAVGLADSLGVMLRQQRADAPDVGKYRRFIRLRETLIGSVQLEQIRLREKWQELEDIDDLVSQAMREVDQEMSTATEAKVRGLFRRLFETQRKYVDELSSGYESYFEKLVDFDASQHQLIERTERLREFIDERVLWMPSGAPVKGQMLVDGFDGMKWLLTPRLWKQLGKAVADVLKSSFFINLFVLLLAGLFFYLRPRVREEIEKFGGVASARHCVRYAPTSKALALSLSLVPWYAGLLGYAGWRLSNSAAATQYTRSIAHGLVAVAIMWLTISLARELARTNGLLESHCDWQSSALQTLRRHLGWVEVSVLPLVFLVFTFEQHGDDLWKESIGRVAFTFAMALVATISYWGVRKGGPIATILWNQTTIRIPAWSVNALRVVVVSIPIVLAIAALSGYYWTSLRLAIRFHFTAVFLFVLLVSFDLFARWILLANRRLAIERARQRREAHVAKRREAEESRDTIPSDPSPAEEEIDLSTVKTQTSRLVVGSGLLVAALGLWGIWADVLPAAGILKQVELWNTTRDVTVTVTVPDAVGVEHFTTEAQVIAVTLADLLVAFLISALAFALIRNLPGLLEMTFFRRFSAGERYAYLTLIKYAIGLVGVVLALNAIGVGWSNVQWLIAAVGLGLGFGLQEIFANFVSGLLILFERPIRVGDTVTVGEISGTVTKIRIRATWITAFDRKELVVPNREFVTSRLINWSHSDSVLRVDVPVGIAYGSDTEKTIQVLTDVALEVAHVLEDPAPQALFLGFGESSLSFELRAFISNAKYLFPVQHQLHMAIDEAFRREGIEIAFPQRDVHVRTTAQDLRSLT